MGDSGNQLDDSKQAQNPDTQHGSILRISVDSNTGSNYKIPNGNPFKNGGAFRSFSHDRQLISTRNWQAVQCAMRWCHMCLETLPLLCIDDARAGAMETTALVVVIK